MAWTKDVISEAPKVIFTPGDGDTNPAVVRMIYDPDAPALRRFVIELTGLTAADQTLAQVEAILGVA